RPGSPASSGWLPRGPACPGPDPDREREMAEATHRLLRSGQGVALGARWGRLTVTRGLPRSEERCRVRTSCLPVAPRAGHQSAVRTCRGQLHDCELWVTTRPR